MNKYSHGGGYRQAALKENISWHEVMDYSTTINWKATEFFPDNKIYLHQDNNEYPDQSYQKLKEMIANYHKIPFEYLFITHGANEAIAIIFNLLNILRLDKQKVINLVGSVYSEYLKYASLNNYKIQQIDFKSLSERNINVENSIYIIVNPNTPSGCYYNNKVDIEFLLNNNAIVIVDESFIDFTEKESIKNLVASYPNLYIIYSLTKFYGSPGARLGVIINNNKNQKVILSNLIPGWNISTYENWFYSNMIPQYELIKKETKIWSDQVNDEFNNLINPSSTFVQLQKSMTHYHTLIFKNTNNNFADIEELQRHLLHNYKVYIRPTKDFYGCSEMSFRIGLRLPNDNEPLHRAIKEIG